MRHLITVGGIALGIAFFASVQTLRVAEGGKDPADAARQAWLIITSLVMCLVGVTNSMLMSVTERYREIGTIKCLGASDGFIVKVFFLEASLLGASGSLLGAILGTGLFSLVTKANGNPISFSSAMGVVLIAVCIGIFMTVVAAIAPAVQAAKMPAAAALRVEI